jgi:hypothetical protein
VRVARASRAFTIVEVLVAAAITSAALVAIYGIWAAVAKGGTTEIWASGANSKLSVADTWVREALARAGYPTFVTAQGIRTPGTASQAGYLIGVSSAGEMVVEPVPGGVSRHVRSYAASGSETADAGTVVVSFYRVSPGNAGLEGKPNAPITGSRVRLCLRRGHRSARGRAPLADLVAEETALAYPASPSLASLPDLDAQPPFGTVRSRLLVADVSRVRISACTRQGNDLVELTGAAGANQSCTVRIEVECLEPYHGQRRISKKIEADTHVGVNMAAAS